MMNKIKQIWEKIKPLILVWGEAQMIKHLEARGYKVIKTVKLKEEA